MMTDLDVVRETSVVAYMNKRIEEKGANRSQRTRELLKVNPSAIKLVMPGVVPTQSYGHQAMGAS